MLLNSTNMNGIILYFDSSILNILVGLIKEYVRFVGNE